MSTELVIKVALADDHKIFRDGIKMALKGKEYLKILWEAEDGKDLMHKMQIKKPDVLLMDEPASALDPISTAKIEELIAQLKQDYTIIIVTHSMQQAARVSDMTGFFYMGEQIEFDQTGKIFTNPSNERTEAYITGKFG